jgi:enoyl-CoA hydratase/carnithine racemase
VRIAAQTARFGSVFIKAGLSSMDMGTSYLLPKIVGAGRARELMLTGRIIDAHEAADRPRPEVVEAERLLPAAIQLAQLIGGNNPFGVWQTKIGLNARWTPSLRHARRSRTALRSSPGSPRTPPKRRRPTWETRPGGDPTLTDRRFEARSHELVDIAA